MSKKSSKKFVSVQVDEDTKQGWVEYQEDHPEFQTVSGLVRVAVEAFIRDEQDGSASPANDELEAKIDRLQTDVEWLRNQQEKSIESLAQELFQVLIPLPADDSQARDAKAVQTVAFDENPQTPAALAESLNTTPKQIEAAIEYLKNHNFPIEQYEMQNGRFQFFKKGQGV